MQKVRIQSIKLTILIILLLFLNIAVIYSLFNRTQQFYKSYTAYSAQNEYVKKLFARKATLQTGISEFDSPFVIERIAKSRLNLKLPEENVVIISGTENSKENKNDKYGQVIADKNTDKPLKAKNFIDRFSTTLFYVYSYLMGHTK